MKKKTEDQKLKTARRRKLINHLKRVDRVNPQAFDLGSWIELRGGDIDKFTHDLTRGIKHRDCGTTCCVAGNLPMLFDEFTWGKYNGYYVVYHNESACMHIEMQIFFGGTEGDWSNIIYTSSYSCKATIKVVIKRIEDLHKTLM